jgi:hypothetical protein
MLIRAVVISIFWIEALVAKSAKIIEPGSRFGDADPEHAADRVEIEQQHQQQRRSHQQPVARIAAQPARQ